MSAASLPIASSMPPEYNVDDPQTSSAFVLRRNYVELLPNEQIAFQPLSGQDMMRFMINDQSSFWQAGQSYFRFNFQAGDSSLAALSKLRLSGVGIDSLFRMIELRAVASGTVLMRQNFYNQGIAAQQYYMRSDEFSVGDGFDVRDLSYKQPRLPERLLRIPDTASPGDHGVAIGTPAAGTVAVDQQAIVTLKRFNAIGVVNVGDILCFEVHTFENATMSLTSATPVSDVTSGFFSAGNDFVANDDFFSKGFIKQVHDVRLKVTSVSVAHAGSDDSTVTGDVMSADITASQATHHINGVYVIQMQKHKTQGSYICDGNIHTICWSPINSVFWQNWPLFLLKGGLELVLYLENPNLALTQEVTPNTASTSLSYKITAPRLVALMSTPEPSIQRDFIGKWNSDQGIVYYCPQMETRKMGGNAADGTMVINVPFGKRSIRSVTFNIVPSNIANGNGALGIVHDAFRSNIRSHVRYLWVQVAANYFPARRIEVDDEANEILWQTKNALNTSFAQNTVLDQEKYQHRRFENSDCYYWTSADGVHASVSNTANALLNKKFETRDRIYTINFARTDGKGGILSGIDGSISSVDITVDRNGKSYSSAYDINESRTGEVNGLADTGEAQWADAPVYFVHGYYDHFINIASRGILVLN